MYVHRGTGHYGFPLRLGFPRRRVSCACTGHRRGERATLPRCNPTPRPRPLSRCSPAPPGPTGQAPLRFEITEVVSCAWEIFTRQWMPLCVGMLLVGLLVAVPTIVLYMAGMFIVISTTGAAAGADPDFEAVIGIAVFGGIFGAMLLVTCFVMPLFIGRLLRMALTAVRGGTPTVGDLFTGEMRYGSMLALMLLQGMLIGLGYMLFIVPGVILALGLYFSAYLVADQRMGAVDAMKASWKLTIGRKGEVFVVMLVFGLLSAVCGMIPLVGHFIGYSLMLLGVSIVYLRLMGESVRSCRRGRSRTPRRRAPTRAVRTATLRQQPYAQQPPPPAGGYGGYGPPYGGGNGPPPGP